MRYRSTLFRIFSYLFVLFVGMSLIGSAQALTLPDGQRGPFQSGKVQVILGADPGTVPDYCGMIAREERIIGFLTQYQLDAKGEPSLSRESITRQLHISDLYPSVVTNERRQLLDTILKNRVNKSFHQDIGRNLLMPVSGTGTVSYIELEGGFFGIITDDGAKFLPLNLPDRYACDGTEVEFTAVIAHDTTTFAMWGVPVNLLSITSIEGEDTGEQSYITGSWICTGYRAGTALQSPITGTEIIADFGTNGMVTGTTGCNVYFAEYVAGDTSLDIENAGMTEMYCLGPDGIMEQEQLFLNLLCSAETFDITNGQLKIRDATGRKILLFDRIGIESENN